MPSYDHLLCNGAAETDPMDTRDDECGTGPEDPVSASTGDTSP